MQTTSFIGMDVHRATISISIAEAGRNAPVRFLGVIRNSPDEIAKMAICALLNWFFVPLGHTARRDGSA
jgi:hypothetical protein